MTDLNALYIACQVLEIHDACRAVRYSVDPDITSNEWKAILPGDKVPIREVRPIAGELSGLMYLIEA